MPYDETTTVTDGMLEDGASPARRAEFRRVRRGRLPPAESFERLVEILVAVEALGGRDRRPRPLTIDVIARL